MRILLFFITIGLSIGLQAQQADKFSINGYFSFEYEKNIDGDDEGDLNGSLDSDLIDLVINFKPTDNLRIATDFTWEHGAASEDGRGNVAVEYAFAEYTINNLVKFRAGKMFTHFGIYNEIHTAKPATLTVKEPLTTNKNNKLGSDIRFYPRWGTGLAVTGNGDWGERDFDYIVQLTNGEDEDGDINPYEEDENTHKAITARMRMNITDDLRVGASTYLDRLDFDASSDYGKNKADLASYGIQAEWMNSIADVELEYVFGDVDFDDGDKVKRDAYTLMLSKSVNSWLIPYFRYEYLDPNSDISNDEATVTVLGVNILVDTNMYLKLEVDQIDTEDANAKYKGAKFSEFKASLSIGF